jgi:hypothetical protein
MKQSSKPEQLIIIPATCPIYTSLNEILALSVQDRTILGSTRNGSTSILRVTITGARTQGSETANYAPSEPAISYSEPPLNVQFLTNGGVTPTPACLAFHSKVAANVGRISTRNKSLTSLGCRGFLFSTHQFNTRMNVEATYWTTISDGIWAAVFRRL